MPITPEFLLVMAFIFLIPLLMAFLSLTLKDKTNRWANMILGIVLAGFYLLDLTAYLTKPYYVLMGIFTIVFYVLIAWYAYKWEKD